MLTSSDDEARKVLFSWFSNIVESVYSTDDRMSANDSTTARTRHRVLFHTIFMPFLSLIQILASSAQSDGRILAQTGTLCPAHSVFGTLTT